MKTLFATTVDMAGGREGRAVARDGKLDLTLTFPAAQRGSGAGTNPEQLFATGLAVCFNTSLRVSAKSLGLDAGEATVSAKAGLTVGEDGAYGITADLVAITPGVAGDDRHRLVAEAKRVCACSNLMKGLGVMSVA